MRTKDEILKELDKNRQPGMYGGIPPDTRDTLFIEIFIDIRDQLEEMNNCLVNIYSEMPALD